MTINEFIAAISKAKDPDLAEITFVIDVEDGRFFEVKSMNQFGISAEVTIYLTEFTPPMIKPLVAQRDKRPMLDESMRKINSQSKINHQ